jgi:hypothetical protein
LAVCLDHGHHWLLSIPLLWNQQIDPFMIASDSPVLFMGGTENKRIVVVVQSAKFD